ncbi:hypothetical protein ACE10Z_35990 [Bradyrhizobium sp. Pha-3]|uniref:hypothetical protein n=1 Tax=Bradyrhizobium sp. Pha-3 TaxID=208375 RepID=UPI0035D42D78
MDSIDRALVARTVPTIIEEGEIRRSSTEASPPADPTDSRQQPSALRMVESSNGGDNSLGSMSGEFRAVLAGVQERLPYSRMNRPYRESALRDGPRFVRNPSPGRASDSSEGILDRNAVLDSSGGFASEADINDYRQWCAERLASSSLGANPLALSVASAERSPLALPNDARLVPHDGAREPTTPGQQTASSPSIAPVRHHQAHALGRRSDTVDTFENYIESQDDTSDSLSFTASEENLRRQRTLLELARLEPSRDRVRSDDSTLREFAHAFALQRGQRAGPSVVGPAREPGFQNQEAAGPSSSAEPLRHRQRLDRAATGPINNSGHLDFGHVVGPNWVHRDQPAPDLLILQLDQQGLLPSSSEPQTSIDIYSVPYTVVRGPGGPRDIRLFRNRYVPPPQSRIATP